MIDATQIEAFAAAIVALITTCYGIYQKVMSTINAKKAAAKEEEATAANEEAQKAHAAAEAAEKDFDALNDLMDETVPMDDAQQALLDNDKVKPTTYVMNDGVLRDLYQSVKAGKAQITFDALERTIRSAEEKKYVEYIIVTYDHDGKEETESPNAFISYGKVEKLGTMEEMRLLSLEHKGVPELHVSSGAGA